MLTCASFRLVSRMSNTKLTISWVLKQRIIWVLKQLCACIIRLSVTTSEVKHTVPTLVTHHQTPRHRHHSQKNGHHQNLCHYGTLQPSPPMLRAAGLAHCQHPALAHLTQTMPLVTFGCTRFLRFISYPHSGYRGYDGRIQRGNLEVTQVNLHCLRCYRETEPKHRLHCQQRC